MNNRSVGIEVTQTEATSPIELEADETSLTLQLYNRLHRDILAAVLPPGRKLKVEDLRRTYGTGATPIREVMLSQAQALNPDQLVVEPSKSVKL